jgi:hypothetical protein
MYLRSNITEFDETNDYCNILNITKAILGATSKIKYNDPIECSNQYNHVMCTSMKNLFENSHVIPVEHYIYIVNILEKSVMNTLNCNNIKVNKIKQSFNYLNNQLIPFIFIILIILYFIKKKFKLQ